MEHLQAQWQQLVATMFLVGIIGRCFHDLSNVARICWTLGQVHCDSSTMLRLLCWPIGAACCLGNVCAGCASLYGTLVDLDLLAATCGKLE